MAEGPGKGGTCSQCAPCDNRKAILGLILQRVETLLDRCKETQSIAPYDQELREQVANAQYVVADMLMHEPGGQDLSANQSARTPPEFQGAPEGPVWPLPIWGGRAGRAGGWMLAALAAKGKERGRATHRHPGDRRPGAQDFSGAKVPSRPLCLYPTSPSSFSDAEEEGEKEEDRFEKVE